MIWLHSDDGAVTGSSKQLLLSIRDAVYEKLLLKWETTLDQIVGIKMTREEDGSFNLSQPGLTKKIIQSFLPDHCPVKTTMNLQKIPLSPNDEDEKVNGERYLSAIGSINYLSVATRLDVMYAVNYLARFSSDP